MKACIWDFDGTVMDTYPGMTAAMLSALQARGVQCTEAEVLDRLKDSLGACVRAYARETGLDAQALERAFRAEERLRMELFRPMDGIREVLTRDTPGIRHFLWTHRDRAALELLKREGLLDCFEDAVTEESGFPRKPDPAALVSLLRDHALEAGACVMIGDRPLDVRAGRCGGARTILLDPEARFPEEACDARVRHVSEIPGILAEWKY